MSEGFVITVGVYIWLAECATRVWESQWCIIKYAEALGTSFLDGDRTTSYLHDLQVHDLQTTLCGWNSLYLQLAGTHRLWQLHYQHVVVWMMQTCCASWRAPTMSNDWKTCFSAWCMQVLRHDRAIATGDKHAQAYHRAQPRYRGSRTAFGTHVHLDR